MTVVDDGRMNWCRDVRGRRPPLLREEWSLIEDCRVAGVRERVVNGVRLRCWPIHVRLNIGARFCSRKRASTMVRRVATTSPRRCYSLPMSPFASSDRQMASSTSDTITVPAA